MAKRSFSAEAFNEAAGKVESGETDFPVIAKGTYVASVAKAFFDVKDSGAEMVSFGFQIDSDDDDYPNQYVYNNQNLMMKNGEENRRGLRDFVVMLNGLTDGHFHKPSFAQPDSRDSELEKLLGTLVKIHVTPKTEGEYTNYEVKIRALLENVYAKERGVQLDNSVDVDTSVQTTANVDTNAVVDAASQAVGETKPIEKQTELQVGMKIILTTNVNGNPVPERGTCIQFIDTGDPETSMVMINPDRRDHKPKAFKPAEIVNCIIEMNKAGDIVWDLEFLAEQAKQKQVEAVSAAEAAAISPPVTAPIVEVVTEEIEELEESEAEWELVKGGAAAFTNKGVRHSGLVTMILEDEGKAIIASNGKNLKVPISMLEKP